MDGRSCFRNISMQISTINMNLYIAIYFDNHKLEIFLTDNIIQHSSYRSVLVKSIFHGSQEVYYGATVSIVYISYLVMMIPSITLPNVQAESSPVFSVTTCLPCYLVRRCLCYNYHSGSSHILAHLVYSSLATEVCLYLSFFYTIFNQKLALF